MGNIINDIVDEVEIKPNKAKHVIKIIIAVSISLITFAFALGHFKSTFFNKMDKFEVSLNEQTKAIDDLENEINSGFKKVDERINKVYTDGFKMFNYYQNLNKEQLLLVIDYGHENKELLKKMINLNSLENIKRVENQIEEAKNDNNESNGKIIALPVKSKEVGYIESQYAVDETNDTMFYLIGATNEYINNIDETKYEIREITKNPNYSNTYNVTYRKK
jgi:hypothetical protein